MHNKSVREISKSTTNAELRVAILYYSVFSSALCAFVTGILIFHFSLAVLPAYLWGINSAGFILMGVDKSLARTRSPRAPEWLLFILAIIGGSPGVFFSIHFFRHKIRKAHFQAILLAVFALQLLLIRELGVDLRSMH